MSAWLKWSQLQLLITLGISYVLFAEATSLLFSDGTTCIVDGAKYGAYYADSNECPALHVLLIKFLSAIFEKLGDPNWVIAAFTVILAFATGFLYFATRDLVKGAERTTQTQLRAFVFGGGIQQAVNLFNDPSGRPYVKEFVFWFPIENVGLTPATDVRAWIMQQKFPMSEDIEPHFDWKTGGTPIVLGPRGIGQSGYLPIPIATMVELWENKTQIYVGTRIEYRDSFNPTVVHHHEQCTLLELLRYPAQVETEKNIPLVILRAYGPQNTTA